MQDFINIVSTLGFPIAVAVFALWNSHQHEVYLQGILDTTLKENTKAIERLSDLIDGGLMWVRAGHEDIMKKGEKNENKSEWN